MECSDGPNLSVATFGEYVWNCSTSTAAGSGGGVLRIVVPPPVANASGLLSVEVHLSTFHQIIVDLSNVLLEHCNVNVTIVLCGAPLLGNTTAVLRLCDRITPAIAFAGNPPSQSNLASLGVLVAVIVERDLRLLMRNASNLIFLPANISQLLDVMLELRSGCVVELFDVPQLFQCAAGRAHLRFFAFNATIQSTFETPTAHSDGAVVNIIASGGAGSIDVSLTQCNVSITQLTSPDASFLFVCGDAVSIANVMVAFTSCNVSISSPIGNVVTVRGNVTVTTTKLSIICRNTTISCSKSLASLSATTSVDAAYAAMEVTSSNVMLSGSQGALLCVESHDGSVFLSNITAAVEHGSTVSFDGEGYLVLALASGIGRANCVSATVVSSSVTVIGSQGALVNIQSLDSLALSNLTATVERGSIVGFVGQGNLVLVLASGNASVICVSTAVRSQSIVTTGGSQGTLLNIESFGDSVLLFNVTVTLESSSAVRFFGEGYLVLCSAVTNSSAICVSITVHTSDVTVWGQGALLQLQSSVGSAFLSNITAAAKGGSTLSFHSNGYLISALAVDVDAASCAASVVSSNLTIKWEPKCPLLRQVLGWKRFALRYHCHRRGGQCCWH